MHNTHKTHEMPSMHADLVLKAQHTDMPGSTFGCKFPPTTVITMHNWQNGNKACGIPFDLSACCCSRNNMVSIVSNQIRIKQICLRLPRIVLRVTTFLSNKEFIQMLMAAMMAQPMTEYSINNAHSQPYYKKRAGGGCRLPLACYS